MRIHLADSEHATVLAALRFWQQEGMGDPANRCDLLHEIATDSDAVISLDTDGIDSLCERLNTEPSISTLEPGPLDSVRTALVSLRHLTPGDRRLLQDGSFNVTAADPEEEDSCYIVSTGAATDDPAGSFPGPAPNSWRFANSPQTRDAPMSVSTTPARSIPAWRFSRIVGGLSGNARGAPTPWRTPGAIFEHGPEQNYGKAKFLGSRLSGRDFRAARQILCHLPWRAEATSLPLLPSGSVGQR